MARIAVVRCLLAGIVATVVGSMPLLAPDAAFAAERRMVASPDADYQGGDYDVMKDVDSGLCETACLSDNRCKAFTFNRKSRWCFLKENVGELRATLGASAGRIVDAVQIDETEIGKRKRALDFLQAGFVQSADELRLGVVDEVEDDSIDDATIGEEAGRALAGGRYGDAVRLYREALKRDASDNGAWMGLADAALAFTSDDYQTKQDNAALRAPAAINAFLTAADDAGKAEALDRLARSMAAGEDWLNAIRTWRAAVALAKDARIQARLDDAVAQHGFRVTANTVDNNAANPRLCFSFSDELAPAFVNSETVGDYVRVDDAETLPVTAAGSQICIDGVEHGKRYHILVRPGIRSARGETIAKASDVSVYVRDRDPSVRFASNAYVLPAGGEATLPVTTINTTTVEARLLRIGDRSLARTIGDGRFLALMESYEADDVATNQGEVVWTGEVDVASKTNEEVTTAIPVSALVKDLKPGVYLLSAKAKNQKPDVYANATQWFILTDIGLSSFAADDGFHVFARSLGTAEPMPGIELELVAANNEVLGHVTTDDKGHARLSAGLLKGEGGERPAVLMASAGRSDARAGDFSFLDMTATPFDLTDRGVEGRLPSGPLDVFLTSDRGIYRTGDVANFTGLVRDARGEAIDALTLTGIVTRPDGVEYRRETLKDAGAGGFDWSLRFPDNAMRGVWRFALTTDPKKPAIAEKTVLVDDFEPQRIDFDLALDAPSLDPVSPPTLGFDVRYLFGAPAPGLAVEGETVVRPAASVTGFEQFRFGLAADAPTPMQIPITAEPTDEAGHATVAIERFEPPSTTKPLEASVQVRVTDAGGRPVEHVVTLPLAGQKPRIGIRPLFSGAVGDGAAAEFEAIALGPEGERAALPAVGWVLNKVTTDYQWYLTSGRWNYEPIRRSERAASGTFDLIADAPAKLSLPVAWGGYELVLTDSAGVALPASVDFDAGWYVAASSVETPDILKVSLDKPRYRIGDKAVAHIEPRFAGKVEVLVMDDRVIETASADIPATGGDVVLDVTRDWGPGAYVTAVLYRPMDLNEKRMPGRAIGLAHATVDPGDRALAVSIEAPAETRPRQSVEAVIDVQGVAAGETAYLTLAAVDVGILNITGFTPPSPKDWYFGRRRLGVEIRDLYSRLIDRMQGAPGSVRSGGDAGASMVSPPPMDDLVAIFSGVVTVGADGKARVPLQLPDFNGTLKLMAVAWSKTGVGEANVDMAVRDPIVIQVSQPRFLAPGDTSRIAIDLNNVDGPSGRMQLALNGGAGVVALEANAQSEFDLGDKERKRILVPVKADSIGDAGFDLTLTAPDGEVLRKSFLLPVRSIAPETVKKSSFELAANGGKVSLGGDLFADFMPGDGKATVSVTSLGGFDIAGVVRALDRYPYGCTEQMTSRALPLVYLDQTILSAGLSGAEDVRERVEKAVTGVLANQSSSGSFGLWTPDQGDLWLDAYVTDFLTRVREAGYPVPEESFGLALDNLRNSISYLPEQPDWGPVAYAYYVLARNGRAAIGDLRYTADNQAKDFTTPLAQAHLAAALALYNDRVRAETVFRMAVKGAETDEDNKRLGRSDYGTILRDGAAVLTLALEAKVDGVPLAGLVQKVGVERSSRIYTSTQEDTWSLLAAHALLTGKPPKLTVNGADRDGPFAAAYSAGDLANPLEISNRGDQTVSAEVTVAGVPVIAPAAEAAGYDISRRYYTLEGKEVVPSTIGQGDRLVAVVEVQPGVTDAARLIIDDPLPAGFEIDNPALLRGGDVGALGFLELTDQAAHTEFRADRFIAAVNRGTGDASIMRFAYVVRAVSPGEFVHPAAIVEDMYRPDHRGRTAEGHVSVAGARR